MSEKELLERILHAQREQSEQLEKILHAQHEADEQLDKILHRLEEIKKQEEHMTVELDNLTVQVKANEDLENSAITLLNGLSAQIAAIKNDPVAIQALADSLKANAANLSAAIIANTPAAPPAP
jgi:hypothetical protein